MDATATVWVPTRLRTRFTIHIHVMATTPPMDTDLATPMADSAEVMDTAMVDTVGTAVLDTAMADTAVMDTVRSLLSAKAAAGPVGASPALRGDGW